MKSSSNVSIGWVIFFLITSVLSGLILSSWAFLAKKSGNSYWLQLFFGLICIVIFGYFISYNFYINYIPGEAKWMYYLGVLGTYSNALAALIWILTLFIKSK